MGFTIDDVIEYSNDLDVNVDGIKSDLSDYESSETIEDAKSNLINAKKECLKLLKEINSVLAFIEKRKANQ